MCELWRVRKAARIRQRHEIERDIMLAWHIERIRMTAANKKKLEPPTAFLPKRARGRQTPREQRAVLHLLSQQYGIPLRVKST